MDIVCKLSSNCTVKIVHQFLINLRLPFEVFVKCFSYIKVNWTFIPLFGDTWLAQLKQSRVCASRTSPSDAGVIWG